MIKYSKEKFALMNIINLILMAIFIYKYCTGCDVVDMVFWGVLIISCDIDLLHCRRGGVK